jgi:hypothetical protein
MEVSCAADRDGNISNATEKAQVAHNAALALRVFTEED